MNLQEYHGLQAERSEVLYLLSRMPQENVIDRQSLEARLRMLDSALTGASAGARSPARARLLFRGKPVVGDHGILAEFGATAVGKFADAVATLAAGLAGPLGTRGTLPNREHYRMILTGVASGSFGFELEEMAASESHASAGPSVVEEALGQAHRLLEATLGSDDDLAEAASSSDPRALAVLREFVKILADAEAVCTLECNGRLFRYRDLGDVRRSADRLSRDSIHESQESIDGMFLGVLPHRRTFEFQTQSGGIVSGKVDAGIADAAEINQVLGRRATIQVLVTRVGSGRPRHRLLAFYVG